MPYLSTPAWAKVAESVLRTMLYFMVLVCGFGAVFVTPLTVSGVVGPILLQISGWLMIAASVPGMIGAAMRKYQAEWPAIWVALGGSTTYVATVWTLVTSEPTRLTQSAYVSIAFLAMAIRAVNLSVTAQKKREFQRVLDGD